MFTNSIATQKIKIIFVDLGFHLLPHYEPWPSCGAIAPAFLNLQNQMEMSG
jgi:hypothetical protein